MGAAKARQQSESERSLKDRAHALLRHGKVEGAMRVYRELLDHNRTDASVWLRYAELCQKANRPKEAISAYHTAAKRFEAIGHTARARATLACALQLAPRDTDLLKAHREMSEGTQPARPVLVKPPPPVAEPPPEPPRRGEPVLLPTVPSRGRSGSTLLLPTVPSRGRSHLKLAPVPREDDEVQILETGFFEIIDEGDVDPLQVTQPYIPLFDWIPLAPK
jgi:tetratricopeptide (TPR) repeat protein